MSRMSTELVAQHPSWTMLPDELEEAWVWMEARGYGSDAPAGYVLTPYAGNRVLGPVFNSNLTLDDWFEAPIAASDRLLPIADAANDGSMMALWRESDECIRIVTLSSDGEGYVIAESPRDLLRLLAIGYDEFIDFMLAGPPENSESIEAVADFRSWVEETFDVAVPDEWHPVGDDYFSAWLDEQMGREQSASAIPPSEVGNLALAGDVVSLIAVLGEKDGEETAASVAGTLRIELVGSLRNSAKVLREAGVEAESDRHGVRTIWIKPGQYPRPEDLIVGLTDSSTLDEALALLGEPERHGPSSLRYLVNGRYLNLGFGADGFTRATLMVEAPA